MVLSLCSSFNKFDFGLKFKTHKAVVSCSLKQNSDVVVTKLKQNGGDADDTKLKQNGDVDTKYEVVVLNETRFSLSVRYSESLEPRRRW